MKKAWVVESFKFLSTIILGKLVYHIAACKFGIVCLIIELLIAPEIFILIFLGKWMGKMSLKRKWNIYMACHAREDKFLFIYTFQLRKNVQLEGSI